MNTAKRLLNNLGLVTALTLTSLSAQALDSLSLGDAAQYNALIFGDFSSPYYSSTTGSVAIEGNLRLDNYGLATDLNAQQPTMSVIVGGDFSLNNGKIYSGHIVVSGSAEGVTYQVRNALTENQLLLEQMNSPINFPALQQSLILNAERYAQYPTTGSVNNSYGALTFNGDCVSPVQVFRIHAEALMSAHTFNVNCIPAAAGVLINITGDVPGNTGLANMSLEALKPYRERVLFNFYEATTLELKNIAVQGSVLAPKADILNPTGDLHGTVIAKSWHGPMHLDYVRFQGVNAMQSQCEGPIMAVSD
ncbi:choice-of-anchor A family protein [Teredinibacter turnerae]|uniref:choice-of-anchor A family protein n=1 Tax=Teredinibacter turnerae TaxID=2426 RepID=UPI000360EAEC|nr:choice-of-anchor A family protein [Teredinibacter turnerae]